MIYRDGEMEEWQLEAACRPFIGLYAKGDVSYVSFFDVPLGKKRYVKFILVDGNWLFVDVVD